MRPGPPGGIPLGRRHRGADTRERFQERPLRRSPTHAPARGRILAATLVVLAGLQCLVGPPSSAAEERTLLVKASAYNSVAGQTQGDPHVAAWGDRLEPGMKVIAVSRDLIAMGLRHGTVVTIEGLSGRYRVVDKMAARWKRKIDIYMGRNVPAARRFGVSHVRIRWNADPGTAGLPSISE